MTCGHVHYVRTNVAGLAIRVELLIFPHSRQPLLHFLPIKASLLFAKLYTQIRLHVYFFFLPTAWLLGFCMPISFVHSF